ncbi:MAG: hypothetical protein RBS19_06885 [Bacteroidales bacterium]|nr:hypothetical protein [Bacteroidales bacterium]MDY0216662.1 hypothetical protein [Bacteroidales bacterium]
MKKYVVIIVLSFFITSFTSCTKSKESKLQGKWRKIDVTNVDVVKPLTIWDFNSGQLTIYTLPIGQTEMIEESKATYSLGFNGTTYTFNIIKEISGKKLSWVKGDGKIVKLNDDFFKYMNKNGYYAEFVRY